MDDKTVITIEILGYVRSAIWIISAFLLGHILGQERAYSKVKESDTLRLHRKLKELEETKRIRRN